MASSEETGGKDRYTGHSPLQLKADFWGLCRMLPESITAEDIRQAGADLRKQLRGLAEDEPNGDGSSPDSLLKHRANSQVRKILTREVYLWSTYVPITPSYGLFIAEKRFGSHYHWGVDPSQFLNPNAFPAYLVGLEDDQDNVGICDPRNSLEIEKADYHEVLADQLYEWKQVVTAFGQAAADDLIQRIKSGQHPEHPTAIRLRNWRDDFINKYNQEP